MRNVFSKILSLILSIAVLSTACCFSVIAENNTVVTFSDDFQSETDTVPDNWEVYNNQTNTSVSVVTEGENKFLRMTKTDSSWGGQVMASTKAGLVSLPTAGEKIVVKMKMRGSDMRQGVSAIHSIRLAYPKATNGTAHTDNGGNQYLAWSMRTYGSGATEANFCYPATTDTSGVTNSGYPTTEKTWYDVTALLDYSAKTIFYKIGFDSEYEIFQANISNENLSLGKVSVIDNITMKLTNGSQNHYTDIDDVKVYYSNPSAELLTDNGNLPSNTKAINVKFDKDMDEATLSESTVVLEEDDGNGNRTTVSYISEYDAETCTYKIDPVEDLVLGKTYYVTLDDEIYAADDAIYAGNDTCRQLKGSKEFSFVASEPKSDNARLSEITVNGSPIADFDADITEYTVKLFYEENLPVPTVTATTEDASASNPVITYPGDTSGDITIKSVAEDGVTELTYTLKLKVVGKEMAELGKNLMINPDFETGTVAGYVDSAYFDIDSDPDNVYKGNYSAKSHDRPTDVQKNFYKQNVNVKANRTYLLSGWFKTKSGRELYRIYPNNSNVERPFDNSETALGSPTEWKRVILTVVTKADTTVTPTILSWETTEDYWVDDLYVGELKPSVTYTGINMIDIDRTEAVRQTLTAEIVNQFGTKNGLSSAEIKEWRIVDAPHGVTTDGDELVIATDAEKGKAIIDIVFEPNYVGANRVLDEDIPEWTHRIEITVNDNNEPIPYAKDLTIDGTVAEGQTLTAVYRYYHKDDVEEKLPANIQWMYSATPYSTYSDIPGATSKDYTVEEAYADKFIRVKIIPEALDGTVGPETTSEKYAYMEVPPTATVTVETPEAYAIGDTLKGKYVYSDLNLDEEGETTFRWLRYNKETNTYEAIDGATSQDYVLTEADSFTTLKFEVTPVSTVEPTNDDAPVLSAPVNGPDKPSIENLRIVLKDTLATVSYDYKHPNGVPEGESIIKWYVNGVERGVSTSYVVSSLDSIYVEVTPVASKAPFEGVIVTARKTVSGNSGGGGGGGGGVSAGNIVPIPVVPVISEKSEIFLTGTEAEHWGANAMNWAIANGYMQKDADGKFNPELEYNREHFLTSVLKMVDMKPVTYKGTFGDVSSDNKFAGLLQAAVDADIISEDVNFYPQRNVSREEVCKIVVNALVTMGLDKDVTGDITQFADEEEMGSWAKGYIAKMLGIGLMQGTDDGKFMPKGTLTKAQTATILQRLSNYVKNIKEGK